MARLTKASADLGSMYEDLHRIGIPDHDTHRRVNTSEAIKLKMVELAKSSLEGNKEGETYHSWCGKDTTSTSSV